MAAYPHMVKTAWNALRTILKQWQENPYLWARERDLQMALAGRLSQILSLQGLGTVRGAYGLPPKLETEQEWSRVGIEPYVAYLSEGGTKAWCHPDIVLWGDSSSSPKYADGESWPILWACELKYGSIKDDGSWDISKLGLLIKQKRVQFGCVVRVHFNSAPKHKEFRWDANVGHGHHLWVLDVHLPRPETDERSGQYAIGGGSPA